jgi:hypothetical protein
MITMRSNSPIEQHNVNRRTCHIAMNVVSADSSCSVVGWVVWATCAEVSTGFVEASKANLGFRCRMAPGIYEMIFFHDAPEHARYPKPPWGSYRFRTQGPLNSRTANKQLGKGFNSSMASSVGTASLGRLVYIVTICVAWYLLVMFCLLVLVLSMSHFCSLLRMHLLGAAECVVTSCVFVTIFIIYLQILTQRNPIIYVFFYIILTNTKERSKALVPRDCCTKRANSRMRTGLNSRPP